MEISESEIQVQCENKSLHGSNQSDITYTSSTL